MKTVLHIRPGPPQQVVTSTTIYIFLSIGGLSQVSIIELFINKIVHIFQYFLDFSELSLYSMVAGCKPLMQGLF